MPIRYARQTWKAVMFAAALASTTAIAASNPSATSDEIEGITVLGARERVIRDFITSYAAPVTSTGQIARWNAALCPSVEGVVDFQIALVKERIAALATKVGLDINPDPKCRPNVRVVFSSKAQGVLNELRRTRPWLFGAIYAAQLKDVTTLRHPVQSWYASATVDANGVTARDDINESAFTTDGGFVTTARVAGRIRVGTRGTFTDALIMVDHQQIKNVGMGALSDYIAMLAIAQTKTFGECRALPSISNLFAPECAADRKSKTLTEADVAYVRALYRMDPERTPGMQQVDLAARMKGFLEQPELAARE